LASADSRREVVSGLQRPCRLALSRRVRFTDSFTTELLDLRVSDLSTCATAHTPARWFIPSPSAHLLGVQARPRGSRWSAPRTNDLDPRGVVCSALPGSMVTGRTSAQSQPDQEPECLSPPSRSPRSPPEVPLL
jgi:hypothetical protein